MPECQGRSAGPGQDTPCPDLRNDDSVAFGHGDLWLCRACLEARFPRAPPVGVPATAMDNNSATSDLPVAAATSPAHAPPSVPNSDPSEPSRSPPSPHVVQNELLCFIQKRSSVISCDDLITICVNFYTTKEIDSARSTLAPFASDKRLPRHKGGERDRNRKTMTDLIKICLDPTCKTPTFYALDITRLPPVSIDHVDVSALLQELVALRQDVRSIVQLRSELDDLKSMLRSVTQIRSEMDDLKSHVRADVVELKSKQFALQQELTAVSPLRTEVFDLKASFENFQTSTSISHLQLQSDLEQMKTSMLVLQQDCRIGSERLRLDTKPWDNRASRLPGTETKPHARSDDDVQPPAISPPDTASRLDSPNLSNNTTGNNAKRDGHVNVNSAATLTAAGRRTSQESVSQPGTRRLKAATLVTGSNTRSALKTASRRQSNIHLFVTRLSTGTRAADVADSVRTTLLAASGGTIVSPIIECEPLETKYNSYMSFHVSVCADQANKANVISVLNSADSWPTGVLVRRYFLKKNVSE